MFDQSLWFAARGAGIVSLLLSTAVVCLGLITATRWEGPGWPRFLTVALHRQVALLSIVFVAIHVASAVFDPFASLGIVAAIIPLASSYRPVAVALGVISVDLLIAVIVTSLLRDRVGLGVWRTVHWAAYAAWPMAVVHSLFAGSDAFAAWMLAIVAACVVAVVVTLAIRILAGGSVRTTLPDVVATLLDAAATGRAAFARGRWLMDLRLLAGPPLASGAESLHDHERRLGRRPNATQAGASDPGPRGVGTPRAWRRWLSGGDQMGDGRRSSQRPGGRPGEWG